MLPTGSFFEYLSHERNYSAGTVKYYLAEVQNLQRFAEEECKLGKITPSEVDAELVREWIVSLMDKGCSPNTVNRKLSSVRTYFKFLLRNGEIEADPLSKVSGPKKRKPLPVFLKEKQMDELLDETDFGEGFEAVRDKAIVGMLYATGMRISELLGLGDADVDFATKLIKVTGKRNKQRLIPFGEELEKTMREYLALRTETFGSSVAEALFIRKDGRRLSRSIAYNIVKRNLTKVVSVKKRSPHVLRHTFATVMLNHGAELGSIKELLGHESLATTEVYTHTTFEELKKVYNLSHPRGT